MLLLEEEFAAAPKVVPPVHSWMRNFHDWISVYNHTLTRINFYPLLHQFLEEEPNRFWKVTFVNGINSSDHLKGDIIFFENGLTIQRSRFRTDLEIALSNLDRIRDMNLLRDIFAKYELDGYVYQQFFITNDTDE